MKNFFLMVAVSFVLFACENMMMPGAPLIQEQEGPKTDADVPTPAADAVTAEQFDTTSQQDRAEATAPAGALNKELGRTIASLGNPTDPGFWLETPLVSETKKGHVVYPKSGVSVAVTLIPIDAPETAGSRISLPAMRLLNAPLAGLPELIVYDG